MNQSRTHTTSVVPMPANENGRGNLAGHKATCSCGFVATTSMGFHQASLDARDHVAFMSRKEGRR